MRPFGPTLELFFGCAAAAAAVVIFRFVWVVQIWTPPLRVCGGDGSGWLYFCTFATWRRPASWLAGWPGLACIMGDLHVVVVVECLCSFILLKLWSWFNSSSSGASFQESTPGGKSRDATSSSLLFSSSSPCGAQLARCKLVAAAAVSPISWCVTLCAFVL